jgi:hypothetical protein
MAGAVYFGCLNLGAQNMDQLKTVLPPSPTASSLGKYADWPVSLYTGVPSISIPLYEMKGRKASVPITLNYHASGIKVSEIASWVGLGFSLDAGGVITRTVRGLPDDLGGYLFIRNSYTNPGDLSSGNVTSPAVTDSAYTYGVANGMLDSEPDYFMLNAMGRSYRLMFLGNGTIVTLPESNIRVTCSDPTGVLEIGRWKVVLEDGTILWFGVTDDKMERVTNAQYGNPNYGVSTEVSAWYLAKLRTTDGEEVIFSYKTEAVEQSIGYSQTDFAGANSGSPPMMPKNSLYRANSSTRVLTKIETVSDSAVFTTSSRQDLTNGTKLTTIAVYSKFTGECVRKFQFVHSYSTAAGGNNFQSSTEYTKRLKLDTLKETSADGTVTKKWAFNYNTTPLPSRTSFAQDHWGYYNGATANSTLLPFHLSFDPVSTPFANREADSVAVLAEMLTKITYPTGGYSVFNYQSNQLNEMQNHYKDTTVHVSASSATYAFHIQEASIVSLQISGTFHDYSDYVIPTYASLVVKNSSNVTKGELYIKNADVVSGSGSAIKSTKVVLMAGDYTLTLGSLIPEIITSLSGDMSYKKFKGSFVSPRLTGGVRVKSIFDYDPISNQTIKRFFLYESPFEIHPIVLTDYAPTIFTRSYVCNTTEMTYDEHQYYARYSSLKTALGSIQGGPIGYGKVTTLYGDNGANGYTVSYFTNDYDLNVTDGTVLPYPPVTDRGWRRGLLREQREYTNADVLVKKVRNAYTFADPLTVKPFKASFKFTNFGSCIYFEFVSQVIQRAAYTVLTERISQNTVYETAYVKRQDGNYDSLATVQNFYYDTPGNIQSTRIEATNSKGQVVKTIKRTALEKTAINAATSLSGPASLAIDSLLAKNRVGEVIQVQEEVAGTLTKRMTTNYKIWSTNPGIVSPEYVMVQTGANAAESRISYSKYDVTGNIVTASKTGDMLTTYIWGYNNTLPIAEVKNAAANKVFHTSFEELTTNFSTDAITGRKSNTATYTVNIPSAGTYTLTYWKKPIGGSWALIQTTISANTSIGGGGFFVDEVRVLPVDAVMTTFAYDPSVGMTSTSDPNNRITYYSYDKLGRLEMVKDHDKNVVKRTTYHLKGQ